FVQVGGEQLWVHNMKLTNDKQSLAVESPGNGPSGDLNIAFDDFALATLSRIAEQDSALVRGMLNGTATLKMGGPSFAFNADLRMDSVSYQSKPIGSLIVQGNSEPNNTYAAYVRLFDYGNEMEVRGTYTATENPTMNFKGTLKQLTMQTVAALSADQLREPQGHMHGTFAINGSPTNPRIGGQMTFHDASFVVAYLNSFFSLQRESFAIENQAVRFNNFTVLDSAGNKATINGNVSIADLTNPVFSLDVNTEDFRVINTNATRDELFYGLILLDSDIRVRGDMALPRVQANLRIEDGSYFTVGIPESEYAVEYGEGVVKFTDPKGLLHPIMTREHHDTVDETGVKGMDIAATIAINRFSTFTLVVDPETGDSLVVRGDASMAFALNPSGNMSLTGTYAINEGSYRLSVQNLAKRDIDIQPGSTITWNGSPTDAMLDLQARYDTRASPIDLMANELVGLDESQSNPYRQKLEFWVLVNIDGPMLTPEMSFELQMPPEDRGALNGSVNAKLLQLNDDPSSLNKQVFALIVLNRFVQDDPLERSGDQGMETVARQSVSKFLSQQLNRLASNYSQVVDLTFDLQSYNDYSSGESEGRTELNVGLQKKLFNDRLTVQFGGSLDLEGERVQDNQVSDLAGDVSVEYALTKDGRWRMRFFQERKYGGLLEGEINERGLGV
ncbi:MAG TPA: translocation/assembly module TamB domain-containing protein, partial [Chitinophagales bacterium]|nr:translocation/assembly module TamB domain-containing protein [Chitinophagales bacterium]